MSERWRRYGRFWGPNVDADIDDEVLYHLDLQIESFLAKGMSPAAARQAALDAFGDVGAIRRALRTHDRRKLIRERRADMLQDLVYDLRYAVRQLRAAPRFTIAVVLVLALGIGANTAIFSAIDAAFFRPLPFPQADRLVSIAEVDLPFELSLGRPQQQTRLNDIVADSVIFSRAAAYASGGLNLTGDGVEPTRANVTYVTSDFFTTMGRAAAVGRVPVAEEFAKNGPTVVVLSNGMWQRIFGGEKSAIGRTIALNGKSYSVVGVMPADFGFPAATELWVPLALPFGLDIMEAFRNYLPSNVVARLQSGVSVAQARQHVDATRRRFRKIGADDMAAERLVRPLQAMLVGDRRTALLILGASAALLLLIACANVTNLLLARASARQREISVRVVLGATRLRIIRQLTVESLLLALAATAMAVLVAMLAVRGLTATLPQSLAGVAPPEVDGRVLLFALAIAFVTSLVFGIWPALGASRSDLGEAMKVAGAGGGGTRRRTSSARGALVVIEVSLAVMLLIGAGLMVESLHTLLNTDSGLRAEHVVTGRLVLPASKFPNVQAKVAFLNAVATRVRSAPGVTTAGVVSALPMEGVGGIGLAIAPDEAYDQAHMQIGLYLMATPGYFATMGTALRGEDLPSTFDSTNKVVVINSTLAKELWPNSDAIGHRIRFGQERRTVIGVVNDIRTKRLDTAAVGQMYLPMAEQPQAYASIVVRGTATNAAMIAHVRDAVHSVDPTQPVYALQSMSDVISTSVAPRRTNTVLLTLFGGLAVVLAAVGVYAVLSYGVTQRTREIGVRVALGAQRGDVVQLIVRQGAVLSMIGIVLGLAGAFALSRFVAAMLYEVDPHDVRVFLGAPLLLGIVAVVAMLTPALRATRVDPLTALRED